MNSIMKSSVLKLRTMRVATRSYFITSVRCNEMPGHRIGPTHKVDNLEKKFLVWTGKYKTAAEVPDFVPPDVMERARNRMRIKIANIMMLATALACLGMVMAGKKKREQGVSVEKMNLEWHRQVQEEEASREAK